MKYRKMIVVGMIMFGGLLLSACGSNVQAIIDKVEPAHLETIDGKDYHKITLTERAAERLDIQTAPVREEEVNGKQYKVLPYSTLIYDLNGDTWVFVSPAPLTFHREAIIVDFIEDDLVVLLDGPPVGTEVVTVGVPELYGIDTGVGK